MFGIKRKRELKELNKRITILEGIVAAKSAMINYRPVVLKIQKVSFLDQMSYLNVLGKEFIKKEEETKNFPSYHELEEYLELHNKKYHEINYNNLKIDCDYIKISYPAKEVAGTVIKYYLEVNNDN